MGLRVLEVWLLWVLPGSLGSWGAQTEGVWVSAAEVGWCEGPGRGLLQKVLTLLVLGKEDVLHGGCRDQPWLGSG